MHAEGRLTDRDHLIGTDLAVLIYRTAKTSYLIATPRCTDTILPTA